MRIKILVPGIGLSIAVLAAFVVLHSFTQADTSSRSAAQFPTTMPVAATGAIVKSEQKISATEGGFGGVLNDFDTFGSSVANLGDLDGDGVADLAVGAEGDGHERGALWVLFMNSDGTVKGEQEISSTEGGFGGDLNDFDAFGSSVANLGDLDGDNVIDLAVGAMGESNTFTGAVWILFMNSDGTVKGEQKISETEGGFDENLRGNDFFGRSVASLGDLDGDGIPDLAVGASGDVDGGAFFAGAVWVLFLNADGTVKGKQKISNTEGGFGGVLGERSRFGRSVANLGDLDGDNVIDLAVGANRDSDGGIQRGAVWILFMNSDGTVKGEQKISATEGGFGGDLNDADDFGISVANLGDLDGDNVIDLAVGASGDAVGFRSAVWILFMNSDGTVKGEQKISATEGGFSGAPDGDFFGQSVANLGDLDGDDVTDLAVGANRDDDGGENRGAVWILFMNPLIITEDLSLTKTASPNPVSVSEDLTYTMVVTGGDADSDTATNVVLTDELPVEVSYISATPTQGECSEADGTVTCDLGSIESETSATVDIVVTPLVVGEITNTASVTSDILDSDTIETSTTTTVQETCRLDLSLSYTSSTLTVELVFGTRVLATRTTWWLNDLGELIVIDSAELPAGPFETVVFEVANVPPKQTVGVMSVMTIPGVGGVCNDTASVFTAP